MYTNFDNSSHRSRIIFYSREGGGVMTQEVVAVLVALKPRTAGVLPPMIRGGSPWLLGTVSTLALKMWSNKSVFNNT